MKVVHGSWEAMHSRFFIDGVDLTDTLAIKEVEDGDGAEGYVDMLILDPRYPKMLPESGKTRIPRYLWDRDNERPATYRLYGKVEIVTEPRPVAVPA